MISQRIQQIRKILSENNLNGFIIPGTDPHQSEYVPLLWKRREYMSGFSGSAGDLVILEKSAALWTDSRYFIQAGNELRGTGITLQKIGVSGTPSIAEWVASQLNDGDSIGIDSALYPYNDAVSLKAYLSNHNINMVTSKENFVDMIWDDRPSLPLDPVEIWPEKYSGESYEKKLNNVRLKMKEKGANIHIITQLDAIAWLLNIRSNDVQYNPVVISNCIVFENGIKLFLETKKVSDDVKEFFGNNVEFLPYDEFADALKSINRPENKILLDSQSINFFVVEKLDKAKKIMGETPVTLLKAIKNDTEIQGFKEAHIKDGVAMVRFLKWLEENVPKVSVTEMTAAAKLESFRREQENCKGLSFETISAFEEHGAIVHYTSSPKTDVTLKEDGIYLVDSGGQYPEGTTDITRTVTFSSPSTKKKLMFTLVLKGHIDLALARFPDGTAGKQLDTIARKPLWDNGFNYSHGTGHGVGTYLNVHEGPHAISYYRCVGVPLVPGMVTSNEPGFYLENEFGIRIENLIYVIKDETNPGFNKFRNLTYCPIDIKLIDPSLLSRDEINYLNNYHRLCYEKLSPYLNEDEKSWLKSVTQEIESQ